MGAVRVVRQIMEDGCQHAAGHIQVGGEGIGPGTAEQSVPAGKGDGSIGPAGGRHIVKAPAIAHDLHLGGAAQGNG